MMSIFTELLSTEHSRLDNVVLVEVISEDPAGMQLFKQALLASARGNGGEVIRIIRELRNKAECYVDRCAIVQGVYS